MQSRGRVDLTRRCLVGGVAAAAMAEPVFAQQTPAAPANGPLVWLDMDQKALDDAYDQSKYAPNIQQVLGRYATNSEAARARLGAPRRLSYGGSAIRGADPHATRARTSSRSISSTFSNPAAILPRWRSRCAAPSRGFTRTRRASAAILIAS